MSSSPEPVVPSASALTMQFKAQLRIWVAAIAGGLVLRHLLPADLVNDQTIDLAVGAIMFVIAAGWQWARTRLIHTKLFAIAADTRVPDDISHLATPTSPPNV